MFILSQNKTEIININTAYILYIQEDYGSRCGIYCDGEKIAVYGTLEKGQKVFKEIFIAMSDGLRIFEMPEN